ncbi:RWP-RK domain [Arabidopsis thaliana x Arabidopsis arenosa]|uniref:RWP-RK domain n=1 Tax=Arabidopsis thaliana x Arabidopsis arenosa TaxID=1240361 RepID=A0A8T1ZPS2_9BRAS|nr:RWP-RK domain [Arabidopsis thaliana x Arabidopsis arenosa]
MENPSSSRDKGFCFPEIPVEEMDGWVKNLISEEDMFSSSSTSELMNFESFASWCNSPSATDILFNQYGLSTSQSITAFGGLEGSYAGEKRPLQEMSSQFYCLSDTEKMSGKRSKGYNQTTSLSGAVDCSVPRSLNHSLDEKMLKALSLFMEFSGEGILAQFWTPIKTGDQYMLSTCDQAYLLDSRLSGYREVSRRFTFSAEANQGSYPGLPGRVFISGVPEWTSNVMYYKTAEYLRMKHALDNEVRGSIAIPVLEASGSCCTVLELVTCREKPNFDVEMDSVCRALQAVNLQTSTIPRCQYLSSNQKEALAEIRDVLRAVCHAHRLPLALAWIPCSYSKGANGELVKIYGKNSKECSLLCIEETSCYVNDMEMEGFVNACLEHYLREGQGIVGKALISNKPSFSSDVKTFDICEYPLVQHARKFGLNAAVATKLRSTFTGDSDYILEFFLPVSMKGSSEQQLLLDSLSGTMQRICRTLRTVSDAESAEGTEFGFLSGEMTNLPQATVSDGRFQTTFPDTNVNSTRSNFSNMSSDKRNEMAGSQGTLQQEISGARRSEKKKSSTEKNVSLNVLQQYFSGSLKDAAKSLGVCPTTLKRICRQHGIMRWPSRKINKVNRSLRKIQTVLDSVQGVEGGLKFDSVTGEFVAVGPFIQEFDTQKSLSSHDEDALARSQGDMDEDASLEPLEGKSHDGGGVKLEEDVETNQAGSGSLKEPWTWISKQSGLIYSDDIDIGKRSEEVKKDKDLCVRRCLSSVALAGGDMNTGIERGNGMVEPNQSISSSMSDSSNSSGAVLLGSSSTSMEQNWNQIRTHNNSGESGSSSTLTVKATYREDTVRFKLDPYLVGCSQLYREVAKRFKLQESAFQLKYLDDEEEWVMLVSDSDLHECFEILNSMRKHTVKFLVRDIPGAAMGSSAGSNGYLGTGT